MARAPKSSPQSQAHNCVACGRRPVDRAHIKTQGSGGTWDDWNIMFLCRWHHSESHALGWSEFSMRYPLVHFELVRKGWCFEFICGIRKLIRS